MPRRNEYTFTIETPMTDAAAMRHAKFFAELAVKNAGYDANATPRKLQSGEEYHLIQRPENINIRAAG